MDFQFTQYLGSTIAKCSMEHEAVANWFNTEVRLDPALISRVLSAIKQIRQPQGKTEISFIGAEYSLFINQDEVMVKANNLAIEDPNQELEDGFYYYDDESISFCGLDDFEHFLQAYIDFTTQ